MNAVLDTNIVIGAAITPKGPPGRIISAWRASAFAWIVSPPLLEELERAFTYPRVQRYLSWSKDEVSEFLQLLRRAANVVNPEVTLDVVSNDPDDNRVLEAAVAGQAEYLVTNDDALLGLKSYQSIEIVTAARFAAILGP
jgi:putative PIN family toxin of toxin-antitoxin system